MESSTPGFIDQLKVKTTKQRYHAEKIFLDHYSDLTYVHLQQELSSEETIKAKKAFEAYARLYRVKVKHYHAENGRFEDNAFQQAVMQDCQTITYCGVNAHFQNGKAEKRIRDLQEKTRKQLHHTEAIWPSAVEMALWPYALRQATHLRNCLPEKGDASFPLERFSKTYVSPQIRENHSFGCLLFDLQKRLAGKRGGVPK